MDFNWEDSVAVRNRKPREGNRFVKEESKLRTSGNENASRSVKLFF